MTGTVFYNQLSRPSRFTYTVGLATGLADGKVVDMQAGEHKSPEFLTINPLGQVPAYKDDKITLFESSAIVRYLLASAQSDLLPSGDLIQYAIIDRTFESVKSNAVNAVDAAVGGIFFGKLFGRPLTEEADAALRNTVDEKFALTEKIFFQDSDYLVGTKLTIADILLLSAVSHLKLIGYSVEKFPKIAKLAELGKSVDYIKKVDDELDAVLAHFQ